MPRSVTSRPSPWRSGWENDKVNCGWAKLEAGMPRLSLNQKLLKESDVVAPEGSNCEIDVSKWKLRCRATKNDCGAACRFVPW